METLKRNLKLTIYGETYTLDLVKSEYESNNRPYLWLVSSDTGEFFADITQNEPDIDTLNNEYLVNYDFQLCFKWAGMMRKRLEKNLNIQSWGINHAHYTFTL